MQNKIQDDLKRAMLAQEKGKVAVLRMTLTALKNEAIAKGKGKELTDSDCEIVIKRLVKQRQDAAIQFSNGGAEDRATQELAEATFLETYLPKQLTLDELQSSIDQIIQTTGATTKKEMGKVMAALKDKHGNGFDAKAASQMVQSRLP